MFNRVRLSVVSHLQLWLKLMMLLLSYFIISHHSVLFWQFHINHVCLSEHLPEAVQFVVRYDVPEIQVDFMCDQKTLQDH